MSGAHEAAGGWWRRLSSWRPGRAAVERACASEARLALALEASGMAIWEMDEDGGRMWWSDEAGRLFGAGPAGPQSRLPHLLHSLHPEDRPAFQAAVAEAVARPGEVRTVRARVVWPDGQVRWVEARGRASGDAGGRPRLRGSLVDVTEAQRVETELRARLEELRLERERAERAQRDGDELYRASFTASPVALVVADAQGRLLEVNAAASLLSGRSREQLTAAGFADLLVSDEPGSGAGRGPASLLALGAGGEARVRRPDGSVRHCLVHAAAIGEDRVLGTLLDITDRREAEERLRENEERFRSLSEASLEAIFVHDGGRVIDVNQTLCDMTGYAWHELIGTDGFELIAPECRELVYRNLLAEKDEPYEIECVRRDGTRLPVEVHARSFPYRGRVLRVVAARDVSARREAAAVRDSLLRALEQKNAELERFGQNVTRELKAPLLTVRGFADQLERDVTAGRADRLVADAARVAQAATRVQRMLDELLAVTQAGRALGPPAVVAADELVREALRLVSPRFGSPGPDVVVAGPLPEVYGDRSRLVRVFEQLLDNAAKFRAPGGAGRVEVCAAGSDAGRVTLVVRDDGIGIDPRHHERVFDPFEKVDASTSGDGLGLAVVRRIVDSHGGRVWLESKGPGDGTAVFLSLPAPPPGARADAALTGAASRPRG